MAVNADSSQARYIFGPYEITDTLGHGGMGVVYRAVDTSLGRPVALKILREDLRSRSRIVARFEREAKAFASLDHPNIVSIHSVGVIGKIPYIAMEFIDGATLGDRLQASGPMPWQEAFRIGAQVSDALASAHAAGIIHRDIKPGNILLNREDKAYVTDFGIAKILTATTKLTVDGTRLGTPQYMSPERCRDEAVTPASDLYALGVLLFQTISGRLPHEAGSTAEIVKRIISDPPARLSQYVPDVPAPVERLVAYLLERKPEQRPKGATAVKEMIEQVLDGKSFSADRDEMSNALDAYRRSLHQSTPQRERGGDDTPTEVTTGHGRKRREPARRRMGWAIAAVAVACILGAGGYVLSSSAALPGALTPPGREALAAWTTTAPVAQWQRETDAVSVVRHAARDLRVTRVSAGRGQVIAELRKGSRAALLTLDAAAQDGFYLVPPSDGLGNLIAAVEIEGRPHALMQAGGNLAMVGLPENAWHEPQTLSLVASATADAAIYSPDAWKGRPTVAVARDKRIDEFYTDEPHSPETLLQANGPVHALAYSDNGEMLAYLEETAPGQQALQVHRFFSVDQVNTLVAEGELRLPDAPFQPGGEDILLQTRANPPRFAVHDTRSGARRLSIDDARTAAWGPAGETILIVAPDRGGRDQLWRLSPQHPGDRTQLTFLEQGIAPAIAVDTDTRMAFAPLHGGNGIAAVRLP